MIEMDGKQEVIAGIQVRGHGGHDSSSDLRL